MLRLIAATAALVLFGMPLRLAPTELVAVPGMLGLGLASIGIVTLARWPATGAACCFVTDYALALWLKSAPVGIVGPAGFGLALVILLHTLEIARCARSATMDAGLLRSQLAGWVGFGGMTLGSAILLMALARGLASAIPFLAAPFLATAGALGVVLTLALILRTRTTR